MTQRELLHEYAVSCIGKDMSPSYQELACADSVNRIARNALGEPIGGGASTFEMHKALNRFSFKYRGWRFVKIPVHKAEPGDIIISPTPANRRFIGHVGILTRFERVISNNSSTGLMDTFYDLNMWRQRYVDKGGLPMEAYRVIK